MLKNECFASDTETPALLEIGQRLSEFNSRFESLIFELDKKLQTIKKIDKSNKSDTEPVKESICIIDELLNSVNNINTLNNRLEYCIMHLNKIA